MQTSENRSPASAIPADAGQVDRRHGPSWVDRVRRLAVRAEVTLVLVVLAVGVVTQLNRPSFLTSFNLVTAAMAIATIAIVALGEGFVIMAGEIDLSLASLLALCGVIPAWLSTHGVNPWLSLVVGLTAGLCGGLLNALLTLGFGVNSFIVTLGTMSVFDGLTLFLTNGAPISNPHALTGIGGSTKIGAIPLPVIVMLGLAIICQGALSFTLWGRWLLAVGDNKDAARLTGISVSTTKTLVFAVAGVLAAFAGMVWSATLGAADPNAGSADLLPVIAAVVIGGVSLMGGRGSILGVLLGAVLLGEIQNVYVLLNLSAYLQEVTFGAVIVIAGIIDQLRMHGGWRGVAKVIEGRWKSTRRANG